MIRRVVALTSAAFALVGLGLPADAFDGPAPNAGTIVSGLADVYAIVPAHGHIYLTPGPGGSKIAVMNPDGSQAGTLDGIPGASGAVAVDDILYVAAFGASEIARFDLSTDPATPLASLSTAPLSSPRDLRYAGGNLWFSTNCGTPDSHVGWMPPDGSSVTELADRHNAWNSCTGLDGNANAPNRIFVHDEHAGSTHLFEYAVGKQQPAFVARDPWSSGNYHGQPATVLPGGDTFAMAWRDGNPSIFSTQDLHGPIGSYHGIGGTIAATDRNGGFVAATRTSPTLIVKSVKIWHLATAAPAVQFTFRDDYPMMLGPLAFSNNGEALYVVTTAPPPDATVVFRVLDPTLQPSIVYIESSDRSVDAGDVARVVVHLDTPGTNHDVTLMAAPWKDLATPSGWQDLGTKTADANGDATFHVSPTRHTYYDAVYAGDAIAVPSTSIVPLTVMVTAALTGEMQGASSVVNGVAHYDDADSVEYAMHVVPDDLPLSFHVHVEVASNGAWLPFASTDAAGDGSGNGTATFTPDVFGPGRYRVSASSYGSVLVWNGEGPWTRFVVDP
jgi:hypothetical protein